MKLFKRNKYSLIFIMTGIVLITYSQIVKLYFDNSDVSTNFSLNKPFYVSYFFSYAGYIWILIGIIYEVFFLIDKIQLVNKLVIKHYWYSVFFLLLLMSVPVLDKFYPTKENPNVLFTNFFDLFSIVSFILFIASLYLFLKNIISSSYSYFIIRSKWVK